MKAVFDTNILIDYLNGVQPAKKEIGLYQVPAISLISWMEVMVGGRDDAEVAVLRRYLNRFEVLPITPALAEEAVRIRRARAIRLPDAIIWATARVHECLLVTRNTKDYPKTDPAIRFPYKT